MNIDLITFGGGQPTPTQYRVLLPRSNSNLTYKEWDGNRKIIYLAHPFPLSLLLSQGIQYKLIIDYFPHNLHHLKKQCLSICNGPNFTGQQQHYLHNSFRLLKYW